MAISLMHDPKTGFRPFDVICEVCGCTWKIGSIDDLSYSEDAGQKTKGSGHIVFECPECEQEREIPAYNEGLTQRLVETVRSWGEWR